MGTGSGILAVTLALEYPAGDVLALDISPAALMVAHENAAALGARNVRFAESDLLAAAGEERFDLVVSNPPYIPLTEAAELHRQVRDHEPHLALFGGQDGLEIIRRLVPQVFKSLLPGRWFLMETAGRSPAYNTLLHGWQQVHWVRDLQGIERIAVAQS